MQAPTRKSEYPSQRQRCGACTAFSAASTGPRADGSQGICAWTNGDDKQPGTVTAQQLVCIYRPSKFKLKEFRL